MQAVYLLPRVFSLANSRNSLYRDDNGNSRTYSRGEPLKPSLSKASLNGEAHDVDIIERQSISV